MGSLWDCSMVVSLHFWLMVCNFFFTIFCLVSLDVLEIPDDVASVYSSSQFSLLISAFFRYVCLMYLDACFAKAPLGPPLCYYEGLFTVVAPLW